MKFILDMQLPRTALIPFRNAGHDAEHVSRIASDRATDIEIWHLAVRHGAIIVTKDEDFVSLSRTQAKPVAIVWLRCGNIANPALIALIEARLEAIVIRLQDGERLIELL